MIKRVVLAGVLCFNPVTQAEILTFQATLDGDQETPAVDTSATGSGTFTFDTDTREFTWNISFSGLSSPQSNAHFHGPAPQCEPAGVTIGLPLGSPIVGSATLSPEHAQQLLDGLWYVNIHTLNFTAGEIRGQIMPTPTEDPLPDVPTGDLHIQLVEVATGLIAPNWGTSHVEAPDHLFVTDQDGTLWSIDLTSDDVANNKTAILDVSSLLVSLGAFGPGSFDERGFLGVAFAPQPLAITRFYTYTSEPANAEPDFTTLEKGQNPNHQSVVREWLFAGPDTPINPGSSRELLRIDQPQFNHNAGCLNFGPDELLYVSLGDGGGADDKDGQISMGMPIIGHGCCGNGQDTETILGAILRIDPFGSDSANGQYGVPSDNPFAQSIGAEVDEIFLWGLRNPFRFSFDLNTGDLFFGDVGQNDIEEVNHLPFPFPTTEGGKPTLAGGNFGWNHKEGSFFFVANGNQPGYVTDHPLAVPADLIDPIAEYDHDDGIAIVGGFVYRGSRIPALQGKYIFGDFEFATGGGFALFYLDDNGDIQKLNLLNPEAGDVSLLGFGQDADGEIYLLANTTGTPFPHPMDGPTGVVLRIAPKAGDLDASGVVDGLDLATLLTNWGMQQDNAADFDQDGDVDGADLAFLLTNWG